jgi:hypothetical protein
MFFIRCMSSVFQADDKPLPLWVPVALTGSVALPATPTTSTPKSSTRWIEVNPVTNCSEGIKNTIGCDQQMQSSLLELPVDLGPYLSKAHGSGLFVMAYSPLSDGPEVSSHLMPSNVAVIKIAAHRCTYPIDT